MTKLAFHQDVARDIPPGQAQRDRAPHPPRGADRYAATRVRARSKRACSRPCLCVRDMERFGVLSFRA
eukprot:1270773-Pleurochrysis_carterae.AAC.1